MKTLLFLLVLAVPQVTDSQTATTTAPTALLATAPTAVPTALPTAGPGALGLVTRASVPAVVQPVSNTSGAMRTQKQERIRFFKGKEVWPET